MQGGESKYRKAWSQICEISRQEFDRVYQRLGVQLEEKVFLMFNSLYVEKFFCRLTMKNFVIRKLLVRTSI